MAVNLKASADFGEQFARRTNVKIMRDDEDPSQFQKNERVLLNICPQEACRLLQTDPGWRLRSSAMCKTINHFKNHDSGQ